MFAAAPDLLEACKAWQEFMDAPITPDGKWLLEDAPDQWDRAESLTRKAIAKAEGKE